MKLLIIADAFPPMRTSAAVHMSELAIELIAQGHYVVVVVPQTSFVPSIAISDYYGVKLVSISTPKTKDVSYLRRVIAEFLLPYVMYYRLRSCSIFNENFDGIIWYSPTIFFGPLISRLKSRYQCRTYLVLRDMFPDWAVDLGLMRRGLPYYILKIVEYYQYKLADVIGIQAPGNFKYFDRGLLGKFKSKVKLLWTWVTPAGLLKKCSIDLSKTKLAGRINFVYAGNIGVAQDFDLIMSFINLCKERSDIGFVFVGRGSEVGRLKSVAAQNGSRNILFFDEIESTEIPALYAQCSIGLVALDPRHMSNNIPGKFLSYMDSGLPVLARLNPGNDLIQMINDNEVGASYQGYDPDEFKEIAYRLIEIVQNNQSMSSRCRNLARALFSTENAAKQIVNSLMYGN